MHMGFRVFYALILGCIITTRYLDKFIILLLFLLRAGVQQKKRGRWGYQSKINNSYKLQKLGSKYFHENKLQVTN